VPEHCVSGVKFQGVNHIADDYITTRKQIFPTYTVACDNVKQSCRLVSDLLISMGKQEVRNCQILF
jgi:hypothetical protein